MKTNLLKLLLVSCVLWLASCTPKNIAYFQDAEAIRGMAARENEKIRLQPEDRIRINVNSSDEMLMKQFNLRRTTGASVSNGSTGSGSGLFYTVDEQGDINFPVLGKVSVIGKTRMEVADYIQERLIARGLVNDPIVTVEFANLSVIVLGSVSSPGRKAIDRDHYTILDAIAASGDLLLTGKRKNVMVNRQVDGGEQVYYLDLTQKQNLLESPAYFMQQNDIVYVEPTNKVKRSTTNIGNTFYNLGWWIALPSTVVSLYYLFKNLK